MKAIVQREYGSTEVLRLEEIDVPAIGAGHVLIRVRAASVNQADWFLTTGTPLVARAAFGARRPKLPVRGQDVAGIVESIGPDVTTFRAGDRVYAEVPAGGFAEFVAVRSSQVAMMPRTISFEQASAVPLAAGTALQGLREIGRLGDWKAEAAARVLINGASGGVGSFAIQIAKALGAEVTAVCSARNAEQALALGADRVIDYAVTDFTSARDKYDLIFDVVGNHPLRAVRRALTRTGTLVLSSGGGGRVLGPMGRIIGARVLAPFVSQQLRVLAATPSAARLDALTELIDSGAVSPRVERVYPLEQTAQALRDFAEQHARGKLVIAVSPDSTGDHP